MTTKMKVKCTVCGVEETLNDETLNELSDLIKKYNMDADSFTYFMNKMRGKCLESNEHSFVFDEQFLKYITEIVNKHKSNKNDVEHLSYDSESLKKEIKELENKIKELKSKVLLNTDKIQDISTQIINDLDEIENITGIRNIDIWY